MMQSRAFIASLALCLSACATSEGAPSPASSDAGPPIARGDGGPATPPITPPIVPGQGCGAGQQTVVHGRVTFPNGTLPVAGALVYVQATGAAPPAHSGQCGECVDATGLLAHAITNADGSFELTNVPAGAHSLVVEKGKFRRSTPLMVAACTVNTVPDDAARLPRTTAEGTLPHIAVVTGAWDQMQSVIEKLGLAAGSFDVFDEGGATGRTGAMLFHDPAMLNGYDIVFVNCGSDVGQGVLESDPTVRNNTKAFVEQGGRIYVTDLAYNLIEQTFPQAVDYTGSSGDGLSSMAETPRIAEQGGSVEGQGTVMDPGLGAWLVAAGATTTPQSIPISTSYSGFAVMERVDPMRGRTWVEGSIVAGWDADNPGPGWDDGYDDGWGGDDWGDGGDDGPIYAGYSGVGAYGNPPQQSAGPPSGTRLGTKPLTITFEQGCGRALYTSYHTVEETSGSTAINLSPQEMVLAYLVLEIGTCIMEPAPTPPTLF